MLCNEVHSSVVLEDIDTKNSHIIPGNVYNIRAKFHVCISITDVVRDVLRRRVLRTVEDAADQSEESISPAALKMIRRQREISRAYGAL